MKSISIMALLALVVTSIGMGIISLTASDHDDGEMDVKGRALNLTDLYVFREDWQTTNGDPKNLVFIMNVNPRSLPRQSYYFSTKARYEFHATRVTSADKTKSPTGEDDATLRFEFGQIDANGRQPISLSFLTAGATKWSVNAGVTTSLADMNAGKMYINNITTQGQNLSIFAGLREDPFFFDVERYFQVRGLLATGVNKLRNCPIQGGPNVFCSDATAQDFTTGYHVNSIAVRLPIQMLQSGAGEQIFDVWETISIPK